MNIINSENSSYSNYQLKLLRRKGVFPYDYLDSIEKLNDDKLPSRKDFYNLLNESEISELDFQHAHKVWRKFNIKSLGDYANLYLKTDVLALADILKISEKNVNQFTAWIPLTIIHYPGLRLMLC